LCRRVASASSEQDRRKDEDDAPTYGSHGEVVWVGSVVDVGDDVSINVEVGVGVRVGVEKSGVFVAVLVGVDRSVVLVTVTVGVSVFTLGTQST